MKNKNLKFSRRARLPRRAARGKPKIRTFPCESAQAVGGTVGKLLVSFRQQVLKDWQKSNAHTKNVADSSQKYESVRFSRRKDTSPFPTIKFGDLYGFPQHCTMTESYTGGASGKPRPTKGTGIFTFIRSRSKKRRLYGPRKYRGILTPACALAQNDGSIGALPASRFFRPASIGPKRLTFPRRMV